MKLYFSLIVFLIFSNYCTAHKTKVKIQNFGNVKTLYISEFNFGDKTVSAEELKMEILGKLSKQIADKLNFKDTIMLERKTYMYHNKSDLFIVEQNDANYKLLKLSEGYEKMEGGSGVAIRIQSLKVDIKDVLKMVEYAIKNKKKLNQSLIPVNYFYNDDNQITIHANSNDFIQKIIEKQSVFIDEIIESEFELLNNGFTRTTISWKNGEFIFGFNDVPPTNGNYLKLETEKYIIKDFKYYIENIWNDFFVVFHDSNLFTYFDGREGNTSSQKLDENISDHYPFRLNKDKILNKILLIPFNSNGFYIYKINKKLLQKIE
ncbi:hypothetical protein [Chryseobacterium luquanense]|uniref:POTRA domain-containing protein n=1 Tax=Chryseobacterium luquanense TaxID=2983766 RepID=A0ABT3Y0H4_9FLAO|nr:hypothetical protein [Chryseobacterium luquanense]MCX8531637.1 hypothetical protein [Chryseobacterium luquanense]